MAEPAPESQTSDLRREAEQRLRDTSVATPLEDMAEADVRALLHELQVHQIELEMQNEELLQAQSALQEVSENYQDLFDFAPIGYFRLDEQHRILELNLAGAALLGLDRSAAVGQRFNQYVTAQTCGQFAQFASDALTAGQKQTSEIELRKNEEPVPVVLEGVAAQAGNGDRFLRVTATDITARKQAERALKALLAEKEVLLKEVHHRVKNNMQVLSSLVSLQASSVSDPAVLAALADVSERMRSMGLVHEKLYQAEDLRTVDLAPYVKSLLDSLWSANRSGVAIELKLALQPVSLTLEKAVPCGLILNELASNTFKHAFRGRAQGVVTISTRVGPDGRVSLCVSDNGVGLPPGFDWQQTQTLGLRLVHLLSKQLGGTVAARNSHGGGTEFEIQFVVE